VYIVIKNSISINIVKKVFLLHIGIRQTEEVAENITQLVISVHIMINNI
jgi:hypothetical protein